MPSGEVSTMSRYSSERSMSSLLTSTLTRDARDAWDFDKGSEVAATAGGNARSVAHVDVEAMQEYCLAKPGARADFPWSTTYPPRELEPTQRGDLWVTRRVAHHTLRRRGSPQSQGHAFKDRERRPSG